MNEKNFKYNFGYSEPVVLDYLVQLPVSAPVIAYTSIKEML